MARNLLEAAAPQHRRAAEELVSGAATPQRRRPAAANPEHRVGTLGTPYERADGIRTVKFNVNLNVELVARLREYTLKAELEGIPRNEWIEAALADAITRGFMPKREG
jgi:hypothetical protein